MMPADALAAVATRPVARHRVLYEELGIPNVAVVARAEPGAPAAEGPPGPPPRRPPRRRVRLHVPARPRRLRGAVRDGPRRARARRRRPRPLPACASNAPRRRRCSSPVSSTSLGRACRSSSRRSPSWPTTFPTCTCGSPAPATRRRCWPPRPQRARERTEVLDLGDPLGQAARYGQAWATVLPSMFESFGMVLVESLACGTPIVVADHSAPPELVRPGAGVRHHARRRRVAGRRACVEALGFAADPATVSRCRAVAEEYSWDRLAQRSRTSTAGGHDRDRSRRRCAACRPVRSGGSCSPGWCRRRCTCSSSTRAGCGGRSSTRRSPPLIALVVILRRVAPARPVPDRPVRAHAVPGVRPGVALRHGVADLGRSVRITAGGRRSAWPIAPRRGAVGPARRPAAHDRRPARHRLRGGRRRLLAVPDAVRATTRRPTATCDRRPSASAPGSSCSSSPAATPTISQRGRDLAERALRWTAVVVALFGDLGVRRRRRMEPLRRRHRRGHPVPDRGPRRDVVRPRRTSASIVELGGREFVRVSSVMGSPLTLGHFLLIPFGAGDGAGAAGPHPGRDGAGRAHRRRAAPYADAERAARRGAGDPRSCDAAAAGAPAARSRFWLVLVGASSSRPRRSSVAAGLFDRFSDEGSNVAHEEGFFDGLGRSATTRSGTGSAPPPASASSSARRGRPWRRTTTSRSGAELGVIGIAVLVALVVSINRNLRRTRDETGDALVAGARSGFLGLSVAAFFLHAFNNQTVAWDAFGIAGLALAAAMPPTGPSRGRSSAVPTWNQLRGKPDMELRDYVQLLLRRWVVIVVSVIVGVAIAFSATDRTSRYETSALLLVSPDRFSLETEGANVSFDRIAVIDRLLLTYSRMIQLGPRGDRRRRAHRCGPFAGVHHRCRQRPAGDRHAAAARSPPPTRARPWRATSPTRRPGRSSTPSSPPRATVSREATSPVASPSRSSSLPRSRRSRSRRG